MKLQIFTRHEYQIWKSAQLKAHMNIINFTSSFSEFTYQVTTYEKLIRGVLERHPGVLKNNNTFLIVDNGDVNWTYQVLLAACHLDDGLTTVIGYHGSTFVHWNPAKKHLKLA